MNKLLQKSVLRIKQEIKNKYLAGDTVPSIARHFRVSDRDLYYHLRGLTSEEKGIHARNSSLKMIKRKGDLLDEKDRVSKSQKCGATGSLADFE